MADVGCAVCCTCIGATCICGFALILGVIAGVGELILSPISIPCLLYRQNKYNNWIEEWVSTLDNTNIAMLEDYFDGPVSYNNINSKINSLKNIIKKCSNNNAIVELKQDLDIIPHFMIAPIRYFWNFMPKKIYFLQMMDRMVTKLKNRNYRLPNEGHYVDILRLKELLIENTKNCSICLEENITTDNTSITPCNHIFHTICLNTWTDKNNTCPSCRTLMQPDSGD